MKIAAKRLPEFLMQAKLNSDLRLRFKKGITGEFYQSGENWLMGKLA